MTSWPNGTDRNPSTNALGSCEPSLMIMASGPCSGAAWLSGSLNSRLHDAADDADLANIDAETAVDNLDPKVPWALAWRIRAAAWQLRHRKVLERALW